MEWILPLLSIMFAIYMVCVTFEVEFPKIKSKAVRQQEAFERRRAENQRILEQAKRDYEHKIIVSDALFFQWDTEYICGQLKQPLRERYVAEREDYQRRALYPLKVRYDRTLVHRKTAVARATVDIIGVKSLERIHGSPYGVDKP